MSIESKKERNERICRLYNDGETLCAIANSLKLTPERISQILKENGVAINRRSAYNNKYEDIGYCIKGTTKGGVEFLIDKEDYEKVKKYSWVLSKTNRLVANISGKVVYLHRFILGIDKGIIDHINGNNRDNRRENLRVTDCKGNSQNKISNNKFRVNGIRKTKQGTYQARITVNYKYLHIGTYKTIEEAIEARKNAEQKYFGEFAPTKRY